MTKKICVILTILFSSMLLALMSMLVIHSATNISVTDDVDDTGVEYIASTEDESYDIIRSDKEPIAYPGRVGYMFIGWYYDNGNGVLQPVMFGNGGDVTGVPNIYAKYETATSSLVYEYDADSSSYKVVGCSDTSVTKLVVPDYYNDGTNGKKPVTAITSNLLENEGTYNTSCKTIFVGNEVQKIDYLASTVSINEYNMIVSSKGCTTLKNIYIGRGLVYISTASIIGCEKVSVQIMARNTTDWEWRAGLASNGRETANITEAISYANFQHSVEKKQYNAILGRKDNSGIYDVHIVYILDGIDYEGDPIAYDKEVKVDAVGTITEINEPLGVVYKADCYFDGWYTKASCNLGSKVTFPHKTVGSVTFYPKFIPATDALSYGYDSAKDCYYVLSNGANLTDTTLVIPDYHSGDNGVKKVGYIETPSKVEDNLLYDDQIVDTLYIGRNINNITNRFAYSSVLTSINYGYTTATNKSSDIAIGDLAFMEIPITKVTIPTNVTSIGANPYAGCSGLRSITVDDNHPNFEDRDSNVVVSKEDKYLIIGCNRSTLLTTDTDVKSIGDYAFYGCTEINEFVLPSNLTRIGNYALYSCSALNITSLDLPDSLTCIGEYAFYNCKAMSGTILTIPSIVTSLGSYAFAYCEGIKTLNFEVDANGNCLLSDNSDNSDNIISSYAFYNCSSLSQINTIKNGETIQNDFPNNITSIGSNAFYGCTSLSVAPSLPAELKIIGDGAFRICNNLTGNLVIPDSVTEIGLSSFNGCGKLGAITLGKSVNTIKSAAFRNCTGITSIHIPASVTAIDGNPFAGCSNVVSIVVEEGNVGGYTSKGKVGEETLECNIIFGIYPDSNGKPTNILKTGCNNSTIPNDTRRIGEFAFLNCLGITGVNIPSTVEYIGTNPFAGCSSIESIVVEEGNVGGYTSEGNIIRNGNYLVAGCKNSTISDDISEIGYYAFYNCKDLEGEEVDGKCVFTLPKSVQIIRDYAFYGCVGIQHLKIGEGINTIAEGAFGNCQLTGLEFAAGVTEIGPSAFSGSFADTGADIIIPYTVITIRPSAFAGSNIKSLTIQDEEGEKKSRLQAIQSNAFNGCSMLTGELILPESIKGISDYAFQNTALTSVTFKNVGTPTSETGVSLGRYAFAKNDSLTSVDLGNNIKEIKQSAFMSCSNLTGTITIPAITTIIGGYCFEGADITKLIFKGADDGTSCLTTISTRSFHSNANLSGELCIPASVEVVSSNAFFECSSLNKITFVGAKDGTSKLKTIGDYAFIRTVTTNTELIIPASVKTIGSQAFHGTVFSNLTFKGADDGTSKLETIGNYAFSGTISETTSLSECDLLIPNSVISIGMYAFRYTQIKSLEFGKNANLQSIGDYGFGNCVDLTGSVTIPDGVNSIGYFAFYGTKLTAIEFEITIGWKKASNASFTSKVSSVNVADPLQNATWLTSSPSYYAYYWKRS
ncbi:MAG: leucine-rich repeat domain-containing protein [Clostridiales bacterium]|nr:leucine-rich repeat domain-containing protein [Clostridiales bacterium]